MTILSLAAALPCLWAAEAAPPARTAGPARADEYQVKAAFLYNFAKFLRWPDESGACDRITVGVIGEDPFSEQLEKTLQGKSVRGKSFSVQRSRSAETVSPCHIVFIGDSAKERVEEIVSRLDGRPVLTLGESEGLSERGVMINLIVEDRRVRFDVNTAAAEEAGLALSSHLLRLARRIEDGKR